MHYLAGTGLFLAIVAALYSTREVYPQSRYDSETKSMKESQDRRYKKGSGDVRRRVVEI